MKLEIDLVELFESPTVRESFNRDSKERGAKVAIFHYDAEIGQYLCDVPKDTAVRVTHYTEEGVRLPGSPFTRDPRTVHLEDGAFRQGSPNALSDEY